MHVSTDKALLEAERQRARLEDEVKNYESKIVNMRQTMDQLVRILCYSNHSASDTASSKLRRITSN